MLTVMNLRVVPGTEAAFQAWWRGHARLVCGLLVWAAAMMLVTLWADPASRQIGGDTSETSLVSWY